MKTCEALIEFEAMIGLGSTFACRILGVSYPAYAKYRSGTRALPRYHQNHVEDIGRLSRRALADLIAERIHGSI